MAEPDLECSPVASKRIPPHKQLPLSMQYTLQVELRTAWRNTVPNSDAARERCTTTVYHVRTALSAWVAWLDGPCSNAAIPRQTPMVYVDDAIWNWQGLKWCHLLADDIDELHRFARRLGISLASY